MGELTSEEIQIIVQCLEILGRQWGDRSELQPIIEKLEAMPSEYDAAAR